MKIGIVIDSNGGMSKEQAEKLGFYYIPMPIFVDGVSYRDGESLTYDQFLKIARETKGAMNTSQVILKDIIDIWNKGLAENDHLIHIALSSHLSKCYESCLNMSLRPEYQSKVSVIDTEDVIGTYLYTVFVAKKLADDLVDKEKIIEILNKRKGSAWGILVPENLTHLKRGGRINAATAALGHFLNFKPLIQLQNGALEKLDKERGSKEKGLKKIIKKMLDHMMIRFDPEKHIPVIFHTNEKEICDEIQAMWQPLIPNNKIAFCNISPIVVCHTGPGAFAIAYVLKHPEIEFPNLFNNFDF